MTPPVTIRAMRENDLGYIVDTWRQGLAAESYLCRFDRDVYFRLMARHIKALSAEPGAHVRVACDPTDEDTIVGYAVLTGDELHYVYVRQTLWKQGIARLLLDGLVVKTHSFRTTVGERRIRPLERGWSYAPRTLRGGDGKIHVEMA
jgi:GNAT superfamily N-acetyltransferase